MYIAEAHDVGSRTRPSPELVGADPKGEGEDQHARGDVGRTGLRARVGGLVRVGAWVRFGVRFGVRVRVRLRARVGGLVRVRVRVRVWVG